MTTKMIAAGIALALVAVPAPAVASGPGDHGPQDGGFPGLPDQALFGICKAFGHADENATAVAAPFQWLTSGMCDGAEHPGQGDDTDAADEDAEDAGDAGPPEHAGPPR